MPEAVVQDVLQLDKLDASEPQVATALLKWGRAQVEADGDDPADDDKLRLKVDSCLKCIRFAQFDSAQFAEFYRGEFGRILNGEEKFQIIECISLKDWEKMPVHLGPVSFTPRTRQIFSIEMFNDHYGNRKVEKEPFTDYVVFMVFRDVGLISFDINPPPDQKNMWTKCSFKIVVSGQPDFTLVSGSHTEWRGDTLNIKLCGVFVLKEDTWYTIYFEFPDVKLNTPYREYRVSRCSKYEEKDIVQISSVIYINLKQVHLKMIN